MHLAEKKRYSKCKQIHSDTLKLQQSSCWLIFATLAHQERQEGAAQPIPATIIWGETRIVPSSRWWHPSASTKRQWKPLWIKCWTSYCESSSGARRSWPQWRRRRGGQPWQPTRCWWTSPVGSWPWHSPAPPTAQLAAAAAAAPSWRCASGTLPVPPVGKSTHWVTPVHSCYPTSQAKPAPPSPRLTRLVHRAPALQWEQRKQCHFPYPR